jgi:structure-specific recognition protein 1
MATTEGDTTLWKHIGLHGHSVGTFACEAGGIKWKSAMFGRDDNVTSGASRSIPRDTIVNAQWTVFGRSAHLRIQTSPTSKLQHELRFDGFPPTDFDTLKDVFKDKFGLELTKYNMSAAGTQFGLSRMSGKKLTFRHCILEDADEEGEEFEPREGEEMLSLDLGDVSQCVLPGNNRNEIELQFPESDAVEANNDQLVSIRFYIPPDPEADPADRTFKSSAELLQQRIMSTANIRKTTGDVIVEFDHDKGSFLTPRGRYSIELCKYTIGWGASIDPYQAHTHKIIVFPSLYCSSDDRYFRMRGQKYDYKIKYDDISRLFLLPKPDDVHMAFVIALDKPIRQGQQRYQHLVLQTSKDPDEVTVNMDEETLKKEYGDDLQQVMRGSLSNLVAKTFKVIAKKKVFIPGKFSNANQQSCVKCALRANEGLLYPLEKQFVFIHKPPVLIRFNEVENIEFQRYAGGQGSTRNFDLAVFLKASATVGDAKQEYLFSGIDRSDYTGLYTFLSSKNMNIKNLEESVMDPVATAPVYNEDEIYGGPDEGMEEESEDESYDAKAAAKDDEGSGSESEDIDDEDLGSEIDDALDSDLEEARKGKSKKKRKPADDDDDVDDDDDDVDDGDESPKKKKKKKSKAAPKAAPKDNSPKKAAKKPKKDPNAPKKPMSNYMLFMNANRARIKEKNPDASFGDLVSVRWDFHVFLCGWCILISIAFPFT